MENLTDEMQEKLANLDKLFQAWFTEAENVCQRAVFKINDDRATVEALHMMLDKDMSKIMQLTQTLGGFLEEKRDNLMHQQNGPVLSQSHLNMKPFLNGQILAPPVQFPNAAHQNHQMLLNNQMQQLSNQLNQLNPFGANIRPQNPGFIYHQPQQNMQQPMPNGPQTMQMQSLPQNMPNPAQNMQNIPQNVHQIQNPSFPPLGPSQGQMASPIASPFPTANMNVAPAPPTIVSSQSSQIFPQHQMNGPSGSANGAGVPPAWFATNPTLLMQGPPRQPALQNHNVAPQQENVRTESQQPQKEPQRIQTPNSVKQSENTQDPRKIFLVNLDKQTSPRDIELYFLKYGPVVNVRVFRFPSGESRGFAAVEFEVEKAAKEALRTWKHVIDGREVEAKPYFNNTDKQRLGRRFQIFLGGVPTFLPEDEVRAEIAAEVPVRDIKLNSERGYAYLDLESEEDVQYLLRKGHIKIGEKRVECKENFHNKANAGAGN